MRAIIAIVGFAPTRVLLVRHATVSPRAFLCGSFDVPLSSEGRAHVAALVLRVRRHASPDAVFTSTLRRARDVADALEQAWGFPARPADWAREIHCGDVEGMRFDDIQRRYPEYWTRNEAQTDDAFAWPSGETYAAFRARILDGLRMAVQGHVGGRLVVVTHAGVISQILGVIRARAAAAWMPDRPRPLTATEITWRNGVPECVLRYDDPDWA
jgi:broad specificity phosphatase PhoE